MLHCYLLYLLDLPRDLCQLSNYHKTKILLALFGCQASIPKDFLFLIKLVFRRSLKFSNSRKNNKLGNVQSSESMQQAKLSTTPKHWERLTRCHLLYNNLMRNYCKNQTHTNFHGNWNFSK